MTPEFLRRYYVMRIISNPKVYALPQGYVSIEQLQNVLNTIRRQNQDDVLYEKLELNSRKTINRDLDKIRAYYQINIKHKRNLGYYIDDEDYTEYDKLKSVYEKTELYLLNHHAHVWKDFVTSARTSLSDYVDVVALINAIEQQFLVELEYKGWYDDNKFQTFKGIIQPLHIKEINNAWYLIAYNKNIGIYAFCLDNRISGFNVTDVKPKKPIDFNENMYFKHSIGILKTGIKPQWIFIKVANHHFKYLEANPIHPSQIIVKEPKKSETEALDYQDPDIWAEIKIFVEPNYEFLMEIFKYNLWVKVVKPQQVKDYVSHHLKLMVAYYD
ncbi:YafY family protein [Mesoflavibacter sp. SCSIO 43206]|uniref:helix-turn-helix transcriptional regulator n=1 Tax=Mesoflavibacter sp. SCSIO 43206 TaxID=2779362 RepID=UPI001CAA12F4|nr:WYL domain-containing protein [Mesoflavibacter sp. SCSIO 43206]UAB74972.1 WYL domain-containing protein [Mesoflavibacter sp. SCSIO 43206]